MNDLNDCERRLCRLEFRLDELSGKVDKICNGQKFSGNTEDLNMSFVPKESDSRERLLGKVLADLNISKIRSVMGFLNWRWRIGSENKVPTEADIVDLIRDLTCEAWRGLDLFEWKWDRNNHFSKTWAVSSGGFQVEVFSWWDNDGSIQEYLRISFIPNEASEESRYV